MTNVISSIYISYIKLMHHVQPNGLVTFDSSFCMLATDFQLKVHSST